MGMGIGEFAKLSGISAAKLRRLHNSGEFQASLVTPSGYRKYDESQLEEAAKYVKRMKLLPGKSVLGNDELDSFFGFGH